MGIKSNIEEFFKTESQKKKEKKEEADFQLYAGKKTLKKEIKRLETEKKLLVIKYKSLRKGTPEYDNTVKAFSDANKSLEDCKDGLAIIEKTETSLVSQAKGGSQPVNVGNIVSTAMKQILDIISSEESAGVMTIEERDRVAYGIEKAYNELPEDTIEDWKELVNGYNSGGMIDEEYDEDTIDEIESMLEEINKEANQRASKRNNAIDKEIEDELAQVRSDRKKLESESND